MNKSVALLILSMCITGCTLKFSLPVDQPTHLLIYKSENIVEERPLDVDPVRLTVGRWLAANPDDWTYAFISRTPRIYLKGRSFYINVSETEVSVKYCRSFFNCHFWIKKDKSLFLEVEKILNNRH